jgi:hypothetical protein
MSTTFGSESSTLQIKTDKKENAAALRPALAGMKLTCEPRV